MEIEITPKRHGKLLFLSETIRQEGYKSGYNDALDLFKSHVAHAIMSTRHKDAEMFRQVVIDIIEGLPEVS